MEFNITNKYLTLAAKKQIVDQILLNSVTISEDGLKYVDFINKTIAYYFSLISFYTDINLDEHDLDNLIRDGVVDQIQNEIPSSELSTLTQFIDATIEQEVSTYNNLSAVLNRTLTTLVDKMPSSKQITSWLNKLPKTLEKISPENMELIKQVINPQKQE